MKKIYSILFISLIFSSNILAQSKMNFSLVQKLKTSSTEIIDVFVKGDINTIEQITASVQGKVKYFSGNIAAIKIPASALSSFVGNKNIQRIEA